MIQTVKGIFIKNLVDLIMKEQGDKGVKLLQNEIGDTNFSAVINYPISKEIEVQFAVMKILYGGATSESYVRLGINEFNSFAESIIGKTIFSLFGSDINKAARDAQKILSTISQGITVDLKKNDHEHIVVNMTNMPYPPEYYQGVWTGAMQHFNKDGAVKYTVHGTGNYIYELKWKN